MLNDKTILITGGTGSFGNAFISYALSKYKPKKLIVYSRDEFKQYQMQEKFKGNEEILRFFVGDVRDKDRLKRACNGVDFIIHAAAMKQVPACEYNPNEAIKTNINGAMNIIDAALDSGVKRVVALSTDKAVNPINLYGGTKLVSDKLFVSANAYSGVNGTRFSVVRYGNVSGSRGSVIPFFRHLVESGAKELPITHTEMTRFWITLEQGVELVIKALNESFGGETYISKIPSYWVTDLARALAPELAQKIVGIREGEKLHEVMVTSDDSRSTYEYDEHYIIYPHFDWWQSNGVHEGGRLVEEGFVYSSGTNRNFMSIEVLREALKGV
jgi:UDP-N-acetylglucosamine 4,6-dehydratase (inverting)